jgi:hypothetical protein
VTSRKRPAGPRFRSVRAVFAGGGRSWVRTRVGEADDFTVRSCLHLYMASDVRKFCQIECVVPTLSVICPYTRASQASHCTDGHGHCPQTQMDSSKPAGSSLADRVCVRSGRCSDARTGLAPLTAHDVRTGPVTGEPAHSALLCPTAILPRCLHLQVGHHQRPTLMVAIDLQRTSDIPGVYLSSTRVTADHTPRWGFGLSIGHGVPKLDLRRLHA